MSKLKMKESVSRSFYCQVCRETHKLTLKTSVLENQKNFPFVYIYFHGNDDEILTTLYLDANLTIRGAEGIKLDNIEGNFNQKKSELLIKKLAREIMELRKQFRTLNNSYTDLQENHSGLRYDFEIYKAMNPEKK